MDGRDGMRAADADREAVAERLRAALGEGRLDLHEYDERVQNAYAARTYADLDALLVDLPPVAPAERSAVVPASLPAEPPSVVVGDQPVAGGVTARWLAEVWLPYLQVIGIVVAVWGVTSMLSGELLYFWPAWVAGPWGAVLAVRTVTGLAGGEPRRRAIERERRRERKRLKRERRRELRAGESDERDDPSPAS
ncbi:DUF1707 SHOCT-like domain-containing protein [Micromonospora profundi]|uniref:DUF1707 domain-containing protein n=1 Tax=Micromonospora profundi TaxID=1420889 RepID=A0AAJ6HYV4_9ACTN|nr:MULTISPECIES: DUF1707 domain-containing protein [Micromonospora]NJC16205.1 hypothetical protein [Micromonospora profundi]WLS47613.1 DUF1707 domain-containing protein [Micromonospora profundi]